MISHLSGNGAHSGALRVQRTLSRRSQPCCPLFQVHEILKRTACSRANSTMGKDPFPARGSGADGDPRGPSSPFNSSIGGSRAESRAPRAGQKAACTEAGTPLALQEHGRPDLACS